jgi:RNA-directed DNA polymerase
LVVSSLAAWIEALGQLPADYREVLILRHLEGLPFPEVARADTAWRFWGLYVHVCKQETLHEAYALAKKNNGAPGIDGVTFEAIEDSGVEAFLKQIQDELAAHTYRPLRNRRQEIPKGDGKVRVLGIPMIRAYCTPYQKPWG